MECVVSGPDMWQDIDENGHNIRSMKNQHIENSLRLFFRTYKWKNRKYMIKCLYLEKLRRIRFGKWNLDNARLGSWDVNCEKELNLFLTEFEEI